VSAARFNASQQHSPVVESDEAGPTAATVADALCRVAGGSWPVIAPPSVVLMLQAAQAGGRFAAAEEVMWHAGGGGQGVKPGNA
jgi:hypothetical protein